MKIGDLLKEGAAFLEKKKSSKIFRLGPKSDSDSVEEEREFKKKAKERYICARCLINSDGKIEREVPGSHCKVCGAPREAEVK